MVRATKGRGRYGARAPLRGFTFVELLIASTVMAILFVGLATHLRGGITVWRRATRMGESLQRQRVALDQLKRDLANAIPYETGQETAPPAAFGAADLAWYTVRPPTEQRLGAVRFVTYRCEMLDDAEGLWWTSQSIGEALAGAEVTPNLLAPGCVELAVEYAYRESEESPGPIVWQGAWDDLQQLPRLLALSVRFEPGGVRRHVAAVPAGVFGTLAVE